MVLNKIVERMRQITVFLLVASFACLVAGWECTQTSQDAIPDSVEPEHIFSCFREILERGDMEQIGKLTANLGQKHDKQWMAALQAQIRRLGLLQRELILGQSVLEPVIKWAQNISHVFINIKTSHRWDSPPCLNTKKQAVFLNQSLLEYVNICLVSQQRLTFVLRISLHKLANIVGEKGENGNLLDFKVTKNGVGMSSAVFEKLEYEIWPSLNKEGSSYPIWTEMAERYPEDHKKYEEHIRFIAAKQRRQKAVKYEIQVFLGFFVIPLLLLMC